MADENRQRIGTNFVPQCYRGSNIRADHSPSRRWPAVHFGTAGSVFLIVNIHQHLTERIVAAINGHLGRPSDRIQIRRES
jgi:hypothetical protein